MDTGVTMRILLSVIYWNVAQNICSLVISYLRSSHSFCCFQQIGKYGKAGAELPTITSYITPLYLYSWTHINTHTHFKYSVFQRRWEVTTETMLYLLSRNETTTSPIKSEYEIPMPNNKWHRTILPGNSKCLELTETPLKIACKS